MFDVFTLTIKFDCLFLGIFWSFHWLVTLIFDELASLPSEYMFQKNALNHFFVNSSAKDGLRRAKNVVFF